MKPRKIWVTLLLLLPALSLGFLFPLPVVVQPPPRALVKPLHAQASIITKPPARDFQAAGITTQQWNFTYSTKEERIAASFPLGTLQLGKFINFLVKIMDQ